MSEDYELEKLLTEFLLHKCPLDHSGCPRRPAVVKELAGKIRSLLSDKCPEGGCHADV